MDIMSDAENYLNKMLNDFASERVKYYPHNIHEGIEVNAVIGKSFFSGVDINGFTVHIRSIDFIIQVDSLKLTPKQGDVIVRGESTFEVFTPNNEPCWRYSGGNFDTYRIHTQAVTNSFMEDYNND